MTAKIQGDQYYYEKLGPDFDRLMSDYDVSRRIDLIFKRLLLHSDSSSHRSVLEIGCGTGKISAELRKRPWQLTVNDISEKLCRQVADSLNCECLVGDCQKLACADEVYDIIVSSECIEHTLNPWLAMKEMKRVLKKGGCLIVTTPNQLWYPVLLLMQSLKIRKFRGIENWTWPWAMRDWLKKNDFSNIYFGGCHLFPWQFPLAKRILPFFDKRGHILYPLMINYGFSAKKGQ